MKYFKSILIIIIVMIVITSGYILLINKKDSKVEYSPTSKIELPVIEKMGHTQYRVLKK